MMLSDAERKFYFDCLRQLTPTMQELFEASFIELVKIHREPGEGDVDRAIRTAFQSCGWIPPPGEEVRTQGRRSYNTKFGRASSSLAKGDVTAVE